jgi:hypothetical protein
MYPVAVPVKVSEEFCTNPETGRVREHPDSATLSSVIRNRFMLSPDFG